MWPGTRDTYRRDPKTWDPRPQNAWVGPGPGTPRVGPRTLGTWDSQFSIVLIVYSNFICYKILWLTYFVANIQKQPLWCVIRGYLNFSKILGKKTEGVPIYRIKCKILSVQVHKCTPFLLFLRCLLDVSEYLFWWLLRKHRLRTMLTNGFLLMTNYIYKEFLIRIKDYPRWHLLVQS